MKPFVLFFCLFLLNLSADAQVLRDQRERSLLREERPKGEKTLLHKVGRILTPGQKDYEIVLKDWDQLLKTHIADTKGISYVGMEKDFAILERFILAHQKLKLGDFDEDSRLAVYINLYNAGMIYNLLKYARSKKIAVGSKDFLVLEIDSLDLSGDIWSNSAYTLPLAAHHITLNGIEHGLIRGTSNQSYPKELKPYVIKTLDPRIHASINCAARSCPPVRNAGYTADTVRKMMQENMINFVNDIKQFTKLSNTKLQANKIIFWYYTDFNSAAKKMNGLKGAGDYFASFVDSTSPDGDWKRRHFLDNFNDRSVFALRFTSDFNWVYDWVVNDKRNY